MGQKTRVERSSPKAVILPASTLSKEGHCPRCHEAVKIRLRNFSQQALSALAEWGEMEPQIQGSAICDGCYDELREVLIDRVDELDEFNGRAGATVKSAS